MIKDLENFCELSNLTLIVEGFPYRNGLSKEAYLRLQSSILPLSEKIKRIADSIDYKATRVSDGYVLTKLYSHADDLPILTEAEIKITIEHIQSTCQKYSLGNEIVNRMTSDI